MGRRCKVCQHEDVDVINRMLMSGIEYRTLSRIFSISRDSLIRHRNNHIPEVLARSYRARDLATPDRLINELEDALKRIDKISDACDEFLQDPENPEKYRLYIRPADIHITYTVEQKDGTVQYRKGKLTDVLNRLEEKGVRMLEYRIRGTDPAELAIKAARELRGYKELIGKLAGLIQDVEVNILNYPEWIRLESVLVEVLQNHPGALQEYDKRVKEVFHAKDDKADTRTA